MRSGYVSPGRYLSSAGNYGYYWSGRALSSSNAYNLNFYSSYVNPSNNTHRYGGQSVRCVASWE